MHCDLLRSIVLPSQPYFCGKLSKYVQWDTWELLKLSKTLSKNATPWHCQGFTHAHSRCSTVSLPLRHLHKGFISFPILYKWPFRPRCAVSRPITTDSCCLLMFSTLIALPYWGPSMRALEYLQSLPDFQHSMCFLFIQSPIACLTTLYIRPSTGTGPVKKSVCTLLSQFVIAQDALMPRHPHHYEWLL